MTIDNDERLARQIEVNGIVQGVGFRPFVYQLAKRCRLAGHVANTAAGVTVVIEGEPVQIESFLKGLTTEAPPLARITHHTVSEIPVHGYNGFNIRLSQDNTAMSTLISADVSVCEDCLRELFDPRDRRFGYPFINCTNCGPRYTIIDDIPYDRPKTAMKHFKMCSLCQAEYDDPENRRFHAQPNACPECGPQVVLYDREKRLIETADPIKRAAELLKEGQIVALKGLGGFHLAVDAVNEAAVSRLRQRKKREEKPLALMAYDTDQIRRFARIGADELSLLQSPRRPIVLLEKKENHPIAPSVSPHNRYFGVMLPYTPLHYLLLSHGFAALVMTSGNLSEEPICIANEEAFLRLSQIADFFLIHNRDIYLRSDDSIARKAGGQTRFIRRSRGYVPMPVFLDHEIEPVLACGAELKNTICITKGDTAFLSQHIGDLENLETYDFLKLTVRHLKRILEIEPQIIACDLHPDYLSTRYAEAETGLKKIQVQHHHAHIVSCMAENRVQGPVIGVALDGTGYGSDGNIWGGEVLVAEAERFSRVAHLAYVPMPGGAAAIKSPWRMGIAYLHHTFGESMHNLSLPLIQEIRGTRLDTLVKMCTQRINSPLTSSLGRLFDGVAAIIGLRSEVHYEGQAAMELEMAADPAPVLPYDYEWRKDNGLYQVQVQPIIRGVVEDVQQQIPLGIISRKFHATLIRLFSELCHLIRKDTGLNQVALSGGSFQNVILLEGLLAELEKKGFKVYTHQLVPTNDGGISLGQAVAADAMAKV